MKFPLNQVVLAHKKLEIGGSDVQGQIVLMTVSRPAKLAAKVS